MLPTYLRGMEKVSRILSVSTLTQATHFGDKISIPAFCTNKPGFGTFAPSSLTEKTVAGGCRGIQWEPLRPLQDKPARSRESPVRLPPVTQPPRSSPQHEFQPIGRHPDAFSISSY